MKKNLKPIQVSQDLFEKILKYFDSYIKEVDNIEDYMTGYNDKKIIYRENNQLICQAYRLNYLFDKEVVPYEESWRQIIVRCGGGLETETVIDNDITGPQAKKYMEAVLEKNYTKKEISDILHAHSEEENDELKQAHYENVMPYIQKFDDCWYYDINNAHGSALLEMFPKSEDDILGMYRHRKDRDGFYKKVFNYYVGMLGKKTGEFRKTYNWIVHRTTNMLIDLNNKLCGLNIYINTDGIMTNQVENPIPSSDVLGQFKREHGTIYTYKGENYWILQFIRDDGTCFYKGSLPLKLRNKIDLSKGKVVSYDRIKVSNHYEYINVEEIILNENN